MVNNTPHGRWFRRLLWVAISANLALALPMIAAPSAIIAMAGLPTATPDVWPRLSALQLVVLSAFYMPAGVDVDRYRANAWFAVAAHVAGGLFFLFEPGYRLFGVYDVAFAVPLAALLSIAVRRERGAASLVPVATLDVLTASNARR